MYVFIKVTCMYLSKFPFLQQWGPRVCKTNLCTASTQESLQVTMLNKLCYQAEWLLDGNTAQHIYHMRIIAFCDFLHQFNFIQKIFFLSPSSTGCTLQNDIIIIIKLYDEILCEWTCQTVCWGPARLLWHLMHVCNVQKILSITAYY